jgi:hypothetical protein
MRARPCSVALVLPLVTVLACTPPAPAPPPPPVAATPPLSEEEIKPLERPNIAITDLDETAGPDGKTVTVSGMLVNRGRGATREVYVHVEALNRDGAVVQFADSEASTELIQSGSTAAFSVKLENRPDIDRYHVEAVSR